mgnify:FL=1|tara:strand:- start:319 stop:1059 length:741 start_codon:yes stop_codon:yes gene_type:complete
MGLSLSLGASQSNYTSFSITDVSNLTLWFQNGVGITSDGVNRVSKWEDSSGNGNHATQSSTGDMALLSGGGLDFERSDSDHYDLANNTVITDNQGFCLVGVLELESTGDNTIFSDTNNELIKLAGSSGARIRMNFNDPSNETCDLDVASGTFPKDEKFLIMINRSAGSSGECTYEVFKNGAAVAHTGGQNNTSNHGFSFDTLGARGDASADQFLDGKILELAFWSRQLTAQEVADVNDYLKNIHGL